MEVKVVCGAVVVDTGKFVLVKEARPDIYGKWYLPSGHLEINENIFTCATREVKEETNLDVRLDGLIGIYQRKNKLGENVIMFYFGASVISGHLKHAADELLDAKWFTLEELDNLKDDEIRMPELRAILKDYFERGLQKLDIIKTAI